MSDDGFGEPPLLDPDHFTANANQGHTGRNLRLPPPENFSGQPEHWEHWSYLFKAYMQLYDNRATDLLQAAEQHTEVITNSQLPEDRQRLSADIHYMLVQLVKGTGITIVKNVHTNCGFETWRQLHNYYQVPNTSKAMGRLTTILNYHLPEKDFLHHFTVWETQIAH